MKQVHIMIKGFVHGVLFRFSVKELADRLGVKGYARNLENGDVEVVAQGHEDKLKEIVEFCRKGPRHARVSGIEVKFSDSGEKYSSFEIIRQ
ncbi:acylphosphatase [Candidatus Woesearchaeota archaeon]|nr:acylphosphatase [Candidatus Woesearchaeota archaeon]